MLALAVGTFLLFFVLSVFNGLSDLMMSVHSSFDPEIKVEHASKKTFPISDSLLSKIQEIEGIEVVTEIIEEDAFASYKESQMVVRLKGVSKNITEQTDFSSAIVEGRFRLENKEAYLAILGRGVQYGLNLTLSDQFHAIQLWYPNRKKKLIRESESSFNQIYVVPEGIFEIERQYDERYMIVPLKLTEKLFGFEGQRTALEIKTTANMDASEVIDRLKKVLGSEFRVRSRNELHEVLYKAIKIEKLATYMIFLFILMVASLNIFLTLSMLVISKKRDIANFYAMGATEGFVKRIFLYEGALIGVIGSGSGLLLGLLFCYLQDTYGIIPMSVESSIVHYMPVKMNWFDGAFTVVATLSITLLISIYPAIKASRVNIKDEI